MTKKEWNDLREGDRVTKEWPQQDGTIGTYNGTVLRFNFNCSQVLVKLDSGSEIWHGRTQIEVETKREKKNVSDEPLTDQTLMPWGKHKGKMLCNVPAYYLIWLQENHYAHGSLRVYIEENMDGLLKEIQK